MLPRQVACRGPLVGQLLLTVVGHVAHRHDGHNRILAGRGHAGVEPRRGVDVEARVGRDGQVVDDALEVGPVVIGQEEHVRGQLLVDLIDAPEEADRGAGEAHVVELLRLVVGRQEVLIDVGQVGVGQHDVGRQIAPALQGHAPRPLAVGVDALDLCLQHELHPRGAGHRYQRLDDAIHAAARIPDAVGQLGVGHHRERRRGLERAEAHVHVLEGERRLQPVAVEVGGHVVVMVHQRLDLVEERQVVEVEEVAEATEVAVDQLLRAQLVVAVALVHVAQQPVERAALDALQLVVHALHVRRQVEPAAVVKDEVIGRVDALQIEHLAHLRPQPAELLFI